MASAAANATPTKSYLENFSTTPEAMVPAAVSDVGLRTFERINATLAELTGVLRTVNAVNLNQNIDGGSTDGTYTKVIQGMPSSADPVGLVPSHQTSITQLAITYCNELVEGRGTISPGAYFDDPDTVAQDITFDGTDNPDMSFTTEAQRNLIINPLLRRVLNNRDGDLSTMPGSAAARQHLHDLIAGNGPIVGLTSGCGGVNCGYNTTMNIIKATCAAAVAGSPMLLN